MEKNTININNYATYVVDYYDHRIDDCDRESLLTFLKQHPKLWEEFIEFGAAFSLEDEPAIQIPDFSGLKKPLPSEANHEEFMVREMENDLEPALEKVWKQYILAHPQIRATRNLYQATKLIPEPDIHLTSNFKSGLKKSTSTLVWFKPYRWAAAAIVLFGIGSVLYLYRPIDVPKPILSNIIHHQDPIGPQINSSVQNDPKVESSSKTNPVALIEKENIAPIKEKSVRVHVKKVNHSPATYAVSLPNMIRLDLPNSIQIATSQESTFLTPIQLVETKVLVRVGFSNSQVDVIQEEGLKRKDVLGWISGKLKKRGGKLQFEFDQVNPDKYQISLGKYSIAGNF